MIGDRGAVTKPSTPLLLRPREAARMLAISERTLHDLTKCGDIPCVRVGRSKRYSMVALRSWIEARAVSR